MTEEQIHAAVADLPRPQLFKLVKRLHIDSSNLSSLIETATAIVADQICEQVRFALGYPQWVSKMVEALAELKTEARNYWENKLEHIKDFMVEPPEGHNSSPNHKGTVNELRDLLKGGGQLEKPELIRVSGTLFPAALLTAGWWERVQKDGLNIKWRDRDGLQKWLFEGFDLWAPSWDISWDLDGRAQGTKPYYVAQLAEGDEADSLAIVFGPKRAKEFRDKFIRGWRKDQWCGLEVAVTGVLGHKQQAKKELPGSGSLQGFDPKDAKSANQYCIWLKDDEEKHDIAETGATALYSGYLWKCLIPRRWIEDQESIGLGDVYVVWEHTNFAARGALKYNLDALEHKQSIIEKKHRKDGGLVLLQKSHEIIVPGDDPKWPIEDFYKVLVGREKVRVSPELLSYVRGPRQP